MPWYIPILICVIVAACNKENVNPFDRDGTASPNPTVEQLPEGNFAWIHQRILRPNCALSGCHDGSFEPEFRSIGSAYNSLVYHPVVANDPQQNYTYRVVPGNVNTSFLHTRLTSFVPNTSGVMPLDLAAGSDWPQLGPSYIQTIAAWIQSGAPNMFGQTPSQGDLEPQVVGMLAYPGGTTTNAFMRGTGAGVQPLEVNAGNVDIWFAFVDDAVAATDLQHNAYRLSTDPLVFTTVPDQALIIGSSINGPDFSGSQVQFTHKATLQLSAYAPGDLLYLRVYVDDGAHPTLTEIPDDGTGSPMRDHFTLRIL